jgi:hypothetical protein
MKLPSEESEKELNDIIDDTAAETHIGKRKYSIGALRYGVVRKMTGIIKKEKDDTKVSAKCVACIILRRYWKIRLLYWLVWRWIYYIREYREDELFPLINAAKKKVPVEAYLMNTIFLTGMRDTAMSMTREEVSHIRQEQPGAAAEPSEKTKAGS